VSGMPYTSWILNLIAQKTTKVGQLDSLRKTEWLLAISLFFLLSVSQIAKGQDTVRIFAQGDSSRLPDLIESCKREFSEHGMKLQLVRSGEPYDYNLVVAQESSISGAAAALLALDSKGIFVASVVRSGRWSGKGAFNASAKELAKKISLLRNH